MVEGCRVRFFGWVRARLVCQELCSAEWELMLAAL